VLIAGPNLTIDRTSSIAELRPGEVLRLADVTVTPGGKGLNVARAARALGVRATLVAFVPGHTGRAAAALIAEEGVALEGISVEGEIRSTSVILEPGRATVLNEPGPALGDADWEALEAAVEGALAGHGVLVCSGSLPPGAPDDGYARLSRGRLAVVDAGGAVLRAALEGRPAVVTPNLAEAEGLLYGRADESVEASPEARGHAAAAAAALVGAGARAAVVTAAAAGAAVAADGVVTWLAAPRVETVVNPIGAGDVLTAALAASLEAGDDVLTAARRGVAAAAASVEAPRAGEFDPARMAALLQATSTPAAVRGV
jgi:1-phosphofructokinase family hexose kinase